MDEPDPLPSLLPYLTNLHSLLQQCRFPAFWALYRSDALEPLRDNYTVEVVGFEDSIREVAVRAVKATFQKIGSNRLGSYLDLDGNSFSPHVPSSIKLINIRGRAGRLYCEAWVEF
jgi:translation initiation factor 3 subunit K